MRQFARVTMPMRDLDRLKPILSVRADIRFLRQPHVLDQPAKQLR
jgi:hypothetical protein